MALAAAKGAIVKRRDSAGVPAAMNWGTRAIDENLPDIYMTNGSYGLQDGTWYCRDEVVYSGQRLAKCA